mgnify:CR=1 FL=1
MSGAFTIVTDGAGHADAIAAVTRAAFHKEYGSGDDEVRIISGLRQDGDVVAELTALEDGAIVGHAMFSKATVAPATLRVAAVGPICARIDRQKSGIGSALMREGLARCGALGFGAVVLLGDPDYYKRFGFTLDAARALECEYSGPHFQALELTDRALSGGPWKLTYPRAFASV